MLIFVSDISSFTLNALFIYVLLTNIIRCKISDHVKKKKTNFTVVASDEDLSPFFPVTDHVTCCMQELRPKGMDVRQDELGDLVDKEMAATSAAIEEAVRRIDVSGVNLKCCPRW